MYGHTSRRDGRISTNQPAHSLVHLVLYLVARIVQYGVQVGIQLGKGVLLGHPASNQLVLDQTHTLPKDEEVLTGSGRQDLVQAIELHESLDLGCFALLANAADLLFCYPLV